MQLSVLCTDVSVQTQTFPCPSSQEDSSSMAGGYQTLDVNDNNALDIFALANVRIGVPLGRKCLASFTLDACGNTCTCISC